MVTNEPHAAMQGKVLFEGGVRSTEISSYGFVNNIKMTVYIPGFIVVLYKLKYTSSKFLSW